MIRLYAVMIAIATVRLVSVPLAYLFRDGEPGVMLITSFWIGWLLTIGAAEWYIRHTRYAANAVQ
jgi:transposase